MSKFRLIGFFILFATVTQAQTAQELVSKVVNKLNTVKDYTANAKVIAAIPLIKIAPSEAKIYFKQKNKFKVEAKGIVLLPKQNFSDMNSFLTNPFSYQAILGDSLTINTVKTVLVTVIPLTESSDIVLAKLWIDYTRNVIMKSQITSKSNGTITTTYYYSDDVIYGLPSKLVFDIDIKKFSLPKSVAADINNKKKTNTKMSDKGKITIILTNYTINKGISDSVFSKKN